MTIHMLSVVTKHRGLNGFQYSQMGFCKHLNDSSSGSGVNLVLVGIPVRADFALLSFLEAIVFNSEKRQNVGRVACSSDLGQSACTDAYNVVLRTIYIQKLLNNYNHLTGQKDSCCKHNP